MSIRNQYVDSLKGLCIFLVIFGHCLQYGSGAVFLSDGEYWDNLGMKFIYSFHMPLFMAISGYLFAFSLSKYGPVEVCKRRIIKLIKPIMLWALFLTALNVHGGGTLVKSVRTYVKFVLTDFWFLWAVLVCSAGAAILNTIIERQRNDCLKIVLIILLALSFLVIPEKFNLQMYKYMFPFFVLGFQTAKNEVRISKLVGVVSTAFWILLLLFYKKEAYIYTTGISLIGKANAMRQFLIDVYRYAIGAFGTIAVAFLWRRVYNFLERNEYGLWRYIKKITEYLGEKSIVLYILSTYLFEYVVPFITKAFSLNYLLTVLETVLVIVICLGVGELIGRKEIVAEWVLGQ